MYKYNDMALYTARSFETLPERGGCSAIVTFETNPKAPVARAFVPLFLLVA
jgi:hypothetical protein